MEKVKPDLTVERLAESQTKNSLTSIISNIYMKYKSVLLMIRRTYNQPQCQVSVKY